MLNIQSYIFNPMDIDRFRSNIQRKMLTIMLQINEFVEAAQLDGLCNKNFICNFSTYPLQHHRHVLRAEIYDHPCVDLIHHN